MSRSAVSRDAARSLAAAYRAESRLLDQLAGVLSRQQRAVEEAEVDAVEDTVFATSRLLVTLGEARRRRRALNLLIGGVEDLDSEQLDRALGGLAPATIHEAREALRRSAVALSAQVGENRRTLGDAALRGHAPWRASGARGAQMGTDASGSLVEHHRDVSVAC